MNCPLRFLVEEARRSKVYPMDVKKFLHGLYATLHLTDQEIQDRLPDFGLDESEI